MKRLIFGRRIARQRFQADSADIALVREVLRPGDWVIDIGANYGAYALAFSEAVGEQGRVVAFEPVPDTLDILTSNVARFALQNVTVMGIAASDSFQRVGMAVPVGTDGVRNFYRAEVTVGASEFGVLAMPVDELGLSHPVRLIKVDAEGHDTEALRGLYRTIERDKPYLLIETVESETVQFLDQLGYQRTDVAGTANSLFRPQGG